MPKERHPVEPIDSRSAEPSKNFVAFGSGTIRAGKKPPFFLVPIELLEAVAETRLHGDRKYKPGNWMQGDTEFFVDCLSHAIKHLIDAPWDDDEEFDTHLGHAACNIAFILWARRRGKISREDYQNAAAILRSSNLDPTVDTGQDEGGLNDGTARCAASHSLNRNTSTQRPGGSGSPCDRRVKHSGRRPA